MERKSHNIINNPHKYTLIYFVLNNDIDDYKNSYIDLHLKKGDEIKKLRFFQPIDLEIEKSFNGNICGMEILDIKDRQLDSINVEVSNFEQDSGITFLAKKVEIIN